MLGRHAHSRRVPAVSIARRAAAVSSDIAALQSRCGAWLVMWSPWRQTYTGFACFTTEPLIIDDADFGRFQVRMRQAESEYGRRG